MADVETLVEQLNAMLKRSTDSAEIEVLTDAIHMIGSQAQTIEGQRSAIKLGDERIETLQILKDGYYSAMAAWRTSKQTGVSITEVLARANRGVASPAQA